MAATAETAQAQTPPRTFVLVHGAYEGGWIWRYVAARLRAKGHMSSRRRIPASANARI